MKEAVTLSPCRNRKFHAQNNSFQKEIQYILDKYNRS